MGPSSTLGTPACLQALGCTEVLQALLSGSVTALSSPGVPFPIIVAWAIGKLYYDNEK